MVETYKIKILAVNSEACTVKFVEICIYFNASISYEIF